MQLVSRPRAEGGEPLHSTPAGTSDLSAVHTGRHPPSTMSRSSRSSGGATLTLSQLSDLHRSLYGRLPINVIRELQLEATRFGHNSSTASATNDESSSSASDDKPAYPQYATLQSRLHTFTHWPHNGTGSRAYDAATPFTLALEGFFQPADKSSPDQTVRYKRDEGTHPCSAWWHRFRRSDCVSYLCCCSFFLPQICFSCGTRLTQWESSDVPHTEHSKVMGSRCALVAMREQAKVQPSMIAIERGLMRTAASTAAAAANTAANNAADDGATADSAKESRRSSTKADKSDPLCLPVPADQIQAAVYSTPISASRAAEFTGTLSSYTSAFLAESAAPSSTTGSSSTSQPLSAFERVRHRHLKRRRSVWSIGVYGDAASSSSAFLTASTATAAPAPSALTSATTSVTSRIESALLDARLMQSALERRLSSLLRKRSRRSTASPSGASSSSPGSNGGSGKEAEIINLQEHQREIGEKIARMESTLAAATSLQRATRATTPTRQQATSGDQTANTTRITPHLLSDSLLRTIFTQEAATALLTQPITV